jgi:hypothetical protein
MSTSGLIAIFAGVGAAVFGAQVGVRRLIRNLEGTLAKRPNQSDDSLLAMVVRREREEGVRFEAAVLFFVWPILLGSGFALAAIVAAWGTGWVVLGGLLAVYAVFALLARIRYGNTRLADIRKVVREALRHRRL